MEIRTQEYSRVSLISQTRYKQGLSSSVQSSMIQPGVIYEAHATTPTLEREGLALSFPVQLDRIHEVGETRRTAVVAFTLLLLNDDYTRIGAGHYTEMRVRNDSWRVNTPISIYDAHNADNKLDAITTGYLAHLDDHTMTDITYAERRFEINKQGKVVPLDPHNYPVYVQK